MPEEEKVVESTTPAPETKAEPVTAEVKTEPKPVEDPRVAVLKERWEGKAKDSEEDEGEPKETAPVEKPAEKPEATDMPAKLKVKFDGEEREVPISEAIELAQKGLLYNKKQHELGKMKRDLEEQAAKLQPPKTEAKQEPPQPKPYEVRLEQKKQELLAYLAKDPEDPERKFQAETLWQQEQAIAAQAKELDELRGWRGQLEQSKKYETAMNAAWDGIKQVMQESGMDSEKAIALWNEGVQNGVNNPVAYYRFKHHDEVKARIEADALKRGAESAKRGMDAGVRASGQARDGNGKFVDVKSMSPDDFREYRVNILRNRGVR